MDVVEFRPEPSQYAWTFGGVAPARRLAPGTVLRLWTEDAFSGRLRRPTDRPSEVLDIAEVNPQTGPFHVEGAEPGDTLALHVVNLVPARDRGASTTIPFCLDRLDAYQLLTQVSASPIANVVDVNYSAVTKVAKRFLPAADAYGGMHRYLREQAAGL